MAHYLSKKRKKSLTLATTRDIALILMLAEQKGFFFENNISIKIIPVTYARKGMEMLISGEVDMATLVETNVAYLGYLAPKTPFKCFASIEKRTADNILIRQDNAQPQDIVGKTVGFMPRTTSHSFLMNFLSHNNIPKKCITLKPLSPQAMPNAFIRGEVDAISVWHPYADNTKISMEELGLPYTHFGNTGFYKSEVVIGASKALLVKNKNNIMRFLKALREAEGFMNENPQMAYNILAEKMKISRQSVQRVLENFQPELCPIGDSYLENIRIVSDWITENDTEFIGKPRPNYVDFIDNSLLLDSAR